KAIFSDYLSGFVLCSSVENGRPLDPADWAVIDVVNYFRTAGFEEQASAFQEQEIDGKSLLLMTRNDVLTGLSLKLGPALKIYEYHVKPLQTQHLKNNSL
uniref:Sterile alpha motif domain containing 13 n=2 Tax=Galloanserae TaxID=1549675 RepID=A0A8B9UB14_9AVES